MTKNVAVIGGGPAGLRAAELVAELGYAVSLYDGMPSVGRKFLVAGKGGLNLTKDEPKERMAHRYRGEQQSTAIWPSLLSDFDSTAMRAWVHGLGIETFVGTSNRVYPLEMKAAPLLRRWVHRLREQKVQFLMRHRLKSITSGHPIQLEFEGSPLLPTPIFDAVILALGGGSWPLTGSTGNWITILANHGIRMTPFLPANCGWQVAWTEPVLAEAEGEPVKNLVIRAGDTMVAGELLITRYGLEGGAIYQLGPELRATTTPHLIIDFKPTFTPQALVAKMGSTHRSSLASVRHRLKLSPGAHAILAQVFGSEVWYPSAFLAQHIKHCPVPLLGPRPLPEAISTAGGVCWSELTDDLMLKKLPGVFVCGEMIDWDAPTGGYLIHGAMATATRAGRGAARWLTDRGAL